jgi:hypothetical protein
MTLYAFATRQYNYINDVITIIEANFDANLNRYTNVGFIWSVGTIASSMIENLLQFAFIADDFDDRVKTFFEFSIIHDLEMFPTNIILPSGSKVDDNILRKVKLVADKYKKISARFKSDKDYTNRDNYIPEWYNNLVKGGLKKLSEAIKSPISYFNQDISWQKCYEKFYHYLCSFKHINCQKTITNGDRSNIEQELNDITRFCIIAFILFNKIMIQACNTNTIYNTDDKITALKNSLQNIQTKISEFEGLFLSDSI